MLQSLHIRDLALIHRAEVEFSTGLNVVSGETGGGKSLLVTALKLLRGERAPAGLVRHGADELRVDAEFALGSGERSAAVSQLLAERCGIELSSADEGLLLVTRIVDANGRSKVRLNDRPATLTVLRELGAWLLEIHGQDESRSLMRAESQAETLDGFAGTVAQRAAFAEALRHARASRDALEGARGQVRERLARIEFLRFQLAEMDELGLEPGEVEQLEQEHRLLGHLDHMRELLSTALACVQDDEPNAAGLLEQASRSLERAAEIDPELRSAAEALAEAQMHIAEVGRAVQSGLGRLDLDPARLAQLEERLADVRRALARFGPGESELLENREAMRGELDQLEDPSGSLEALEARFASHLDEVAAAARKLVRARQRAVARFCAAIEHELRDLSMAKMKFRVAMPEYADGEKLLDTATAHGPSTLDFEVCINPGEPFHSMRETASGGEMARIVLAIKKCLADQDRVPFLAFDEIDAEIGGRLGLAVGDKLAEVARHHQVLIVTHLPQVAAFADAHFKVEKRAADGRTASVITALDAKGAERELAAMSVGEGADKQAIAQARRLVAKAKEREGDAG